MKLSVIYDSRTGNTKRCAEWIAEGMGRVAGVEAKTFSTKDVDEAFVKEHCHELTYLFRKTRGRRKTVRSRTMIRRR